MSVLCCNNVVGMRAPHPPAVEGSKEPLGAVEGREGPLGAVQGCQNNYSNYPNIIFKYPNTGPSKNPEMSYNDYAKYNDEQFYI